MKTKILALIIGITVLAGGMSVTAASAGEPPSPADKAFDMYWAKRRQIKVIQKRKYMKEGRWEFGFRAGIIPNDDFWLYFPVGIAGTYFVSEDVGVELEASYMLNKNSDLKKFLEGQGLDVTLPQFLFARVTVNGLWSPFHGKIGLFTSKLFHFDFTLSFGGGAILTKVDNGNTLEMKTDVVANAGAGFRIWVSDNMAMQIGYRHYFYPAEGGGVSLPAEIGLGFSYFTGAP